MIASNHPHTVSADSKNVEKPHSPIALACQRLREAGLRITQPRTAILAALIKRGQPTSIEQLHSELPEGSCDLVTVYRCLSAFEQIGLVRRSFFHNGTSLYAIALNDSNRYHVVCKTSNRVEEINDMTTADLRACVQRIEDILKSQGYSDVSHVVEFFGRFPQTKVATPVS